MILVLYYMAEESTPRISRLRKLSEPLSSRSVWLNAVARRSLRALFICIIYAIVAVPLVWRAFKAPARGLKHPSTLLAEDEEGVIL